MRISDSLRRLLGLFLVLWGADIAPEGYHTRPDVGERSTIDGTPLPTLWDEFIARLSVFNTMHARIESMLAQPTSVTTERVAIPRRARMEQASEFGQPKLIRTERVARGYPLVHYDIGIGFTQEFLDEATSAEIRNTQLLAEEAWRRRRRQTLYEALFTEDNATDKDGILVRRLYNGDGEVPPEYESYSHDGTHTHYLTSAGASLAAADLTTLETHLLHHGYGDDLPGGAGGSLILHVGRDLMDDIRGFTGFIPAQTASIPVVLDGVVVGGSASAGPGVQGFFGRFAIVEDLTIPANYLLAFATGGAFSPNNPVRMRQHSNPSARGLRLNPGRQDYPLQDSFFDGYVGAGIAHRGAAVVMLVTAGAYAAPDF